MDKARMNAAVSWIWYRKEAFIWLGALIFLGFSDPACHHYTLCPLDNLGFDYCPGCGLGRSIGFLFRLDIRSSFMEHPLGIPALCLLVYRMIRIFHKSHSYELSTI
jgi:hypothetical protein